MLKKILVISTLMLSSQAFAASVGNWTAKFSVGPKHAHSISHSPNQICLDDAICTAAGLYFGAGTTINGITISSCALDLKIEMSKAEFVNAMKCSGLDPIEKK